MNRSAIFAVLLVLGLALCTVAILPFVPALLWATTLAILARPLMDRLKRLGPTGSALLATLLSTLLLTVPLIFIGLGVGVQVAKVADQLQGRSLESLTGEAERWLAPYATRVGIEHLDLREALRHNAGAIAAAARPVAARFAATIGGTLGMLLIALLAQFYLMRDGERLKNPTLDLSPLPREETLELLARATETVRGVFVGTILVSALQGALLGVTLWLLGVPNALLLGVLGMLLCIVPVLGAPALYVPVGLYLIARGEIRDAAIFVAVGALVVSQVDNVVRPMLIGDRVRLHPLAIFFAILGGTVLVGPIGLIAGPMLLTITLSLLDALRRKMVAEPFEEPSPSVLNGEKGV